jgi:hypothetical protein
VNSDARSEPDENFFLSLSRAENASVTRDKGEGTIVDTLAVDGAPTAREDSYSTARDQTLRVDVPGLLGNDSDPEGGLLTAVEASEPAHGEVFVRGDGSFAYFPDDGYLGADSFTYKANDDSNSSDLATVEILVRDISAPEVLSLAPPKTRGADVTIRFSEAMDPGTLMQDAADSVVLPSSSRSVLLLKGGPTSTAQVLARVRCAEETCQTVVLDPDVRLGARKQYTVEIKGTGEDAGGPVARDVEGNELAHDYVKSFRTGRR